MNPIVVFVLVLVPTIKALCYGPALHGLAPDVILPHMFSSEVFCPPPHVFDYFNCLCVDPSVVRVNVPQQNSLQLSLLTGGSENTQPAGLAAYSIPSIPRLSGLPDTHDPRQLWIPVAVTSNRRVPELNPFGSFNMPANSNVLKVAARAKAKILSETAAASKQLELLEKVRWQQQLEREVVAVAAANLAAVASSSGGVTPDSPTLDGFMRDTLRRLLYGY